MGLGRRTFAPGEVLTASNVMNYLMDQSVMSFAGTAARGSAIGTAVQEGMVSYLADSNAVQVYDGSSWLNIGPSGQILQISHTSTNTQVNSSTTTLISTGLSIAFTPISSTSKIIVMFTVNGISKSSGSTTATMNLVLRKDSTNVYALANNLMYELGTHVGYNSSGNYVETSGSTSARTYAVFFSQWLSAGTVNVQRDAAVSTMTIIEVSQ